MDELRNDGGPLRPVALQDAGSIDAARHRAEEELQATREALRESEERLRAVFNQAAVGIAVARLDGRFEQVNRRLLDIVGYSFAEIAELTVLDITHVDDRPGAEAQFRRILLGQITEYANEQRFVRKDGSSVWSMTTVTLLKDAVGQPRHFIGIIEDITERKTAEDALRARERELSLIYGNVSDIIFSLGVEPDGGFRFVSINPAFTAATGLCSDQVIGKLVQEVIPEPSRTVVLGYYNTAIGERRTVRWEETSQYPFGMKTGRVSVTPIMDASGTCVNLIGTVHDITERKQEEELRARLAAVVESSDDAIISKTLDGIITTWNKGAQRMFGYVTEEVIGKSITILIPTERLHEEVEILRKLRAGQRIEHYETVRACKDGTLLNISLSVSPIHDGDGKLIGASKIARDITGSKRLAEEREHLLIAERAARAEAERVGIMKDEFLANLSHELRTPLNAILGWSQLLRSRDRHDEELTEGLAVIERNTRMQTQLIEDLLDMSRIISGKIRLDVQKVELHEVIQAAVDSVRHSADTKQIRLQLILDPLAGPVQGDPGRLQQCFWNLLSNAIKFTPRGGWIRVSLERVNSHVEVCVSDNGEGIRPEFLPHLFERFRQADASTTRRHGGLGLGLSIVKHLIEVHGGKVRAKSSGVGQGATFCIELPVMVVHLPTAETRREHPTSAKLNTSMADHPSLAGITVLVVDDEPDARNLVRRVLEECGAKVILAASAQEAMDIMLNERPHMIISDIGMPGEDGYEFIRKVRALRPEHGGKTPAAALTAFARAEDRTRALRAGYQSHVAKPVEPTELTAVVASLATRT